MARPAEGIARLCVIDLGTNSFHAVIVDIHPDRTFTVVDKIKEPVALGDAGMRAKILTTDAATRAVAALGRIKTLADRREVGEIMAYATSAIREAGNGEEFVDHVRDTLGIDIEPISGEREADLIYRGVRRVVDLSKPALLVDIGGGSTEFVVADDREVSLCTSLAVGAARLTELFVTSDPISEADLERLRAHLDEALDAVFRACEDNQVTDLIGSSGTVECIVGLALKRSGRDGRVAQHAFPAGEISEVTSELIASDRAARLGLPGVDRRRASQIAAGAVLLETLIDTVGIERVRFSPAALREGMVELYIERNADEIGEQIGERDVLIRRARELSLAHDRDLGHSRRVADLALQLFEQLEPLHGFGADERRLLEAAAVAHDIGHAISGRRHHKHTRYIIEQSEWPGVKPRDVAMVANIARYHRRALPKKKHGAYKALSKKDRKRVRKLAALLRLADKLDRTHVGNTESLRASVAGDTVHVTISTRRDPELEVRAGRGAIDAFEDAFGHELEVHAAWHTEPGASPV